jgi:Ni,Fe-hydrogenase I cytochrome b subunit
MNKNLKNIFNTLIVSFFLEYLLFFFIFEGNSNEVQRGEFVALWIASLFIIVPIYLIIKNEEG